MVGATDPTKLFMRDSIRQFFPTGRMLATVLTHISQGIAADANIEAGEIVGDEASIVLLPQFAIRDFEGSESVNRIQWDGDGGRTVRTLHAGESACFPWRVKDSTLPELTGTLTATSDATGTSFGGDCPPVAAAAIPGKLAPAWRTPWGDGTPGNPIEPSAVELNSPGDLSRQLRRISAHGQEETFSLASLLNAYANDAVRSASLRVYREIDGLDRDTSAAGHIVDSIEREVIVDELLWGVRKTDSLVIRLLRRVAATDATVCKSVRSFIATAIWSGAETQVRKHIGDPHLGRVIRRIARQLGNLTGNADIDASHVLDAYRRAYPDQSVGIGRVRDALTAGATVHSRSVTFDVDGYPQGGKTAEVAE